MEAKVTHNFIELLGKFRSGLFANPFQQLCHGWRNLEQDNKLSILLVLTSDQLVRSTDMGLDAYNSVCMKSSSISGSRDTP